MAFPSKDGKKNNSKFRAARRDKEAGTDERAQAHEAEGVKQQVSKPPSAKPSMGSMTPPETDAPPAMGGGADDSQSNPHGPAHAIHITHDHAAGTHHVHAMHPDGHEEHTDHATAQEAHAQAADAGGAGMGDQLEDPAADPTGEYPQKHKTGSDDDADDYEVEALD